MKTDIIDGAIELDLEPHDIMDIPPASLWELCRCFDAEMGKSLKGINSGLCVYEYFKSLTETGKVANYEDTIKDAFKKKCIAIAEILDIGSEMEDIGH